ncbi:MAG: hypothetical protein ACOYL5_05200 [Phototrophicaceae bacterium]
MARTTAQIAKHFTKEALMNPTFEDFLQQLPPAVLGIFWLFCILLVISIGVILIVRYRGAFMTQTAAPAAKNKPAPASKSSATGDMPDLSVLLGIADASNMTSAAVAAQPMAIAGEVPRQPGIVHVKLANGKTLEAAELLVMLRDRKTDELIVQIGDLAYSGSEANIDAEYSRRFVRLMRELREIAPQLGSNGGGAPPIVESPVMVAPVPAPVRVSGRGNAPKPEATVELDLATEINRRVQAKVAKTDAFAGRVIQVMNAPDGGVRIEVDRQFYSAVDEITDVDVRELIASAIADWQAGR